MEPLSKSLGVTKFPLELFDEQGRLIYCEHSDGFWSKREYNEQGNWIYYESSNGLWFKRKYNEQGRLIYYENSDGFWSIKDYNEQGYLTYRGNSDGFWSKSEHDEQGNRIYYEDNIRGIKVDKRQYSRSVDVPGIGKVSMETIQEALKERFDR